MAVFFVPLISCAHLLFAWLASCLSLVPMGWPCCGLLHELGLLFLLLGRLRLILLPVLGPCLRWPFVCLCCFSLARSSSLGNLNFLWLGLSLPCLLFYYSLWYFLGKDRSFPLIVPFTDDHVNVPLCGTIAHLQPLFSWILPCMYPHCMLCGLEVGDVPISRETFWCYYPHLGDGFL